MNEQNTESLKKMEEEEKAKPVSGGQETQRSGEDASELGVRKKRTRWTSQRVFIAHALTHITDEKTEAVLRAIGIPEAMAHTIVNRGKHLPWGDGRNTLIINFWMRVVVLEPDQCWLWVGGKKESRYGMFAYHGFSMKSHRLAYIMAVGDLGGNLCGCHTCDNPPCVNPAHIFAGTQKDNAKDKMAKGRHQHLRGEKHGKAKLRLETVLEIKRKFSPKVVTAKMLAKEYGLPLGTVASITGGINWSHFKTL